MKKWIVCAALLLTTTPAWGQGADLQALLSGKEIPFTLPLKELNADWRRLKITGLDSGSNNMLNQLMQIGMMAGMPGAKNQGQPGGADAALGMAMLGGMFGGGGMGGGEPVYYTKGQTVVIGGETFIVTYTPPKKEGGMMQAIMEASKDGGAPDFAKMAKDSKLTPETALTMTLVNVKTVASLGEVRPFDMNREIAESESSGGLMEALAKEGMDGNADGKTTPEEVSEKESADSLASIIRFSIDDEKTLKGKVTVTVVEDSIVLRGAVTREAQKKSAQQIAAAVLKDMEAKTQLVNEITVKSSGAKKKRRR